MQLKNIYLLVKTSIKMRVAVKINFIVKNVHFFVVFSRKMEKEGKGPYQPFNFELEKLSALLIILFL